MEKSVQIILELSITAVVFIFLIGFVFSGNIKVKDRERNEDREVNGLWDALSYNAYNQSGAETGISTEQLESIVNANTSSGELKYIPIYAGGSLKKDIEYSLNQYIKVKNKTDSTMHAWDSDNKIFDGLDKCNITYTDIVNEEGLSIATDNTTVNYSYDDNGLNIKFLAEGNYYILTKIIDLNNNAQCEFKLQIHVIE